MNLHIAYSDNIKKRPTKYIFQCACFLFNLKIAIALQLSMFHFRKWPWCKHCKKI